MRNAGFMPRGQLLNNCGQMVKHKHRISIVHGRADFVCQPLAAHRLAKALTSAGLPAEDLNVEFVAGAGHSDSEPGNIDALIRKSDEFRSFLSN